MDQIFSRDWLVEWWTTANKYLDISKKQKIEWEIHVSSCIENCKENGYFNLNLSEKNLNRHASDGMLASLGKVEMF